MTLDLMLLVLAYVLLLALLLLVLIYSRLPLLAKLLLSVLVAGAYVLAYQGWQQAQGWPGRLALPEQFLLHGAVIEEPDPETGSHGRIFLWASTLEQAYPAAEPRAYELPYDKANHSALQEAQRRQRNGELQLGRLKSEREGDAANRATRLGENQPQRLEFSKLPDPALPEK
ncbi:MAG: hypothetical protein R3E95_10075 [Thiolinea sp.]